MAGGRSMHFLNKAAKKANEAIYVHDHKFPCPRQGVKQGKYHGKGGVKIVIVLLPLITGKVHMQSTLIWMTWIDPPMPEHLLHSLWVTCFRGGLMLYTVISILAVDFSCFHTHEAREAIVMVKSFAKMTSLAADQT
eukprot:1154968-Pelagomonas_calceolata.AAC.10